MVKVCSGCKSKYVNGSGITFHQNFGVFGRKLNLVLGRAMASGVSYSNHLGQEKSPYLLQHASNPVNWYPWGEEAFGAARKENKIIFLSVGYSTCHWCHVMERESFENESIAKIMNENFINIKVDREERPDVDKVYMMFVTASSGHGGWPMSVFLTPDLVPVMGGTYFPPEDRYGRPGFGSILKAMASKSLSGGGGWPMSVWLTPDLKPIYGGTYYPPDDRYFGQPGFATLLKSLAAQWRERPEQFHESGRTILEVLKKNLKLGAGKSGAEIPSDEIFTKALNQLTLMYDPHYGGFGDAPKFPQASNFSLIFAYKALYPEGKNAQKGVEMAIHTLRMMERGGIHDHVCQGFARYSTDKKWHVPHFEKMLYDQAQLIMAYLDAFLLTKEELCSDVVRDIMTYVTRDLTHPEGGFYSAEDADSLPTPSSEKKREGAFCVWTNKEIGTLLSAPMKEGSDITLAKVFSFHFSVAERGNVDPYQDPHDELKGQNVLMCHGTLQETADEFKLSIDQCRDALERGRSILYEERRKRPRPHLDDKMVAAWNGMMMASAARAGAVLNNDTYLALAAKNAHFIKSHLWKDGVLLRAAYKGDVESISLGSEIRGFSDDYAWVIRGLLHLYDATLLEEHLIWAEELMEKQNELFWDADEGGFFMGSEDDQTILLRLKEDHDGAEPSVNSISAGNLVRLSRLLQRPDYEAKASSIFKLFSERLKKVPVSLPEMTASLMLYRNPAEQIILGGDRDSKSFKEMLAVIHTASPNPNRIILVAGENPEDSLMYSRHESLRNYLPKGTETTAYVCKDFVCSLPSKSPSELRERLSPALPSGS